ncbi:MAG: putative metal-binding motif-containing protein [Myxococcota bacterium]
MNGHTHSTRASLVTALVLAWTAGARAQVLFEETFDDPGTDLTYGFDGHVFGNTNLPWTREHLTSGGVNNSPCFRATATFNALIDSGGVNYYFFLNFTGDVAAHNRQFWLRQCWKFSDGFLDARDPEEAINPKLSYIVATNGGNLVYATTSGAFVAGERVVGETSGARADLFSPDASYSRITNVVDTFAAGEVLVGQQSAARATFVSYDPQWRNVQLNHFWHPGSVGDGSRGDGFQDLRWQDQSHGYYFSANNPLNDVQHASFLVLQEHYDEWICLETLVDVDQAPWVAEIYVTTAWGAANLAPGTTGLDTGGRRHFHDYLYIRFINPVAPALEDGFGFNWIEYGSYGGARTGDQLYLDEMVIATSKIGHPFAGGIAPCGNGSCEAGIGETCTTCPADCACSTCTEGATRDCYTGASATLDVGACQGGSQTCTGGAWETSCAGEVLPATEHCSDVLDNDCDGTTDGADSDCPAGCQDADSDGYANITCGGSDCNDSDGAISPVAVEVCGDRLDNDCDGAADNAADGSCTRAVSSSGCDCTSGATPWLGLWLAAAPLIMRRRSRDRWPRSVFPSGTTKQA